jgi:hypothetical protein
MKGMKNTGAILALAVAAIFCMAAQPAQAYDYYYDDYGYGYDDYGYGYDDYGYGYDDYGYGYDDYGYGYDDYGYGDCYDCGYDDYYYDDCYYYDCGYDDYGYANSTNVYVDNTSSSYSSNENNNTIILSSHDDDDDDDDNNDDLDVYCRADDSSVEEGDTIVWRATATGGDGDYDYDWSGTDGLDGDERTVSKRYNDSGTKTARVTVRSDGDTATADCSAHVSDEDDDDDDDDNDDLDVVCRVSDATVEEGDRVTFEVEIDSGESPFDIRWDSNDIDDDDLEDAEDEEDWDIRLDDEDRYEVEVTVTDDEGNRDSDECPVVRVSDENEDDDDVTVISNPPSGTPSSGISSVYLSQIPYTGTKEVIAFIMTLLVAIAGSAYLVYRSAKSKTGATRASAIESFKQANLAAKN